MFVFSSTQKLLFFNRIFSLVVAVLLVFVLIRNFDVDLVHVSIALACNGQMLRVQVIYRVYIIVTGVICCQSSFGYNTGRVYYRLVILVELGDVLAILSELQCVFLDCCRLLPA